MKAPHIRIAVIVLCAVLAAVTLSVIFVHGAISGLLAKTAALSDAADSGTLGTEIAALEEEWASRSKTLRLLLPNSLLAELNEAILRLQPEYDAGSDALTAEIAGIRADLIWMHEKQTFLDV